MSTIRDVAKRAGVSEATVSYVINNGPRPVAAQTRAKILRVMKALDYHPNATARQLARRKTECLGVVSAGLGDFNFSNSYFIEYIRGITYGAEMRDYNILLLANHRQAQTKSFYQDILRSHLVDGLFLIGSSIPDSIVVEFYQKKFPALLIARRVPDHETYAVYQDYRDGAYQATRYLIANGYRRIGFLGQALQFSYGRERFDGYCQALAEANISYDPSLASLPSVPRDDPTVEEVNALLRASTDALLTDRELPVSRILRDLRLRVPDDIALVGLDESESADLLDVPLTTMRAPKFELGVAAVEMLLKIIDGEKPESQVVIFPMQLIVRASSPVKSSR